MRTDVGTITARAATGWEFVSLYRAEHPGPFRLQPAEIDTGGWFTIPQLERWTASRPEDFASGFLECFRRFRESAAARAPEAFDACRLRA